MNDNFKNLLKDYDTKLKDYILKINKLVLEQEITTTSNELLKEFEIILNNFLDFLVNLKTKTFISNEEYFLILNYLEKFNYLLSTELKELKNIYNNIEIKELLNYNIDLLQEYSNKFLFLIHTVDKLNCLKEHSKLLNNFVNIKKSYLNLIKNNNNNNSDINIPFIKLKKVQAKNEAGFFKLYFIYIGIMLSIIFLSILSAKFLEKLLLSVVN